MTLAVVLINVIFAVTLVSLWGHMMASARRRFEPRRDETTARVERPRPERPSPDVPQPAAA